MEPLTVSAAAMAPARDECKLLSGTFATLLQILLGIIALSVLVVKRFQEVPRRPVAVWAFDASKQMVGAGFAHVANLLIAILLYQNQHGDVVGREATAGVDQCAFYFVNFTMDTTIGVVFNWVFLEMFSALALRCNWTAVQTPGDYGQPIQVTIWLKQLVAWIAIIFVTKFVIAVMIVLLEKPLAHLAIWLFAPLQPYPRVELALVMIACPCLMNALQFWVQDSFLKKDVRADCTLASTMSPEKLAKSTSNAMSKQDLDQGDDDETEGGESETADTYASDGSTATTTSSRSKRDVALDKLV